MPSTAYLSEQELPQYKYNFDNNKVGQLPRDWKITETRSGGWFSSASKSGEVANWNITHDSNATAGNNSLDITKINNYTRSVFNIIHTNKIKFNNGQIEVKIRANSGKIDQGGGPIWRYIDNKNYYVARYNPLERNFRVYYVKDGRRIKLQSARNIEIKQHEWFEIKISHVDEHIEAWLNGKKLLDVKDATHKVTGGVGLWTKADALTSFDDFKVTAQ